MVDNIDRLIPRSAFKPSLPPLGLFHPPSPHPSFQVTSPRLLVFISLYTPANYPGCLHTSQDKIARQQGSALHWISLFCPPVGDGELKIAKQTVINPCTEDKKELGLSRVRVSRSRVEACQSCCLQVGLLPVGPTYPDAGWWLRNGRGQGWGRTPFRTTATRSEVGRGMFTRKIWKRKKGLPGTEAEVKRRESLLGPFLVSSSLVHSNKWKPVRPVDVGTALWQHDVYIYIYSCRHWLLLYKHLATASHAVPGVDLRFFFFHFFHFCCSVFYSVGQSLAAMNSMAGVEWSPDPHSYKL